MKILISTDIEGVAGVFHPEQVRPGNGEYERARVWMTQEANAAVQGAFAGGADEVLVNDSHGGFRNLLPDMLDERAQLVLGKPRQLGMMAGLATKAADNPGDKPDDKQCDAVFLIGYHARAHSPGILAHTINGAAFARVTINGQELGEAGLYGALAGELGVPVALASGDDAFITQTRDLFPGATWVQTKTASGQYSGTTLAPIAAQRAIARAAQAVIDKVPGLTPFTIAAPIECVLATQTPALADLFCLWPTLERLDGTTVSFNAASMLDAVRMLNSLAAMSFMLR